MKIERFEDIEAWKLARELTNKVYALTQKKEFSRDFELRDQIRAASGSAMHNIAEGFDADSTAEFIRFLRYTKRSCSEVQSKLYIALDELYISQEEFQTVYDLAGETRACTKGFIKYLKRYASEKKSQLETLSP
jgi:four helix bundle protein